jgi:muramidase (phage lysozyme)
VKKVDNQQTVEEAKQNAKLEEEAGNKKITAWNAENERLAKEDYQNKLSVRVAIGQLKADVANKNLEIGKINAVEPQTQETIDSLAKANAELSSIQKEHDDLQKHLDELNAQPIPTPTPVP